jgi:hypothetical protein
MIDQRGFAPNDKLKMAALVIEIDEDDLPRLIQCWAHYLVISGEPNLYYVDADSGGDDGQVQTLTGNERKLATVAVNAAVTDTPVNSGAWTAVERAIERHREEDREQNRESTRELFAGLGN